MDNSPIAADLASDCKSISAASADHDGRPSTPESMLHYARLALSDCSREGQRRSRIAKAARRGRSPRLSARGLRSLPSSTGWRGARGLLNTLDASRALVQVPSHADARADTPATGAN